MIAAYPVWAQDATSTGTTRKEKIQERLGTRRENTAAKIDAMKEGISSREAAFKKRLEAFKDQKRAQLTDKVNTTLGRINQKQTNMMARHLEKMSAILDKLEARVNSGTPDIKDPAAAKSAIGDARKAISAAMDAVKAQAENNYTLTLSDESKVRQDAESSRKKLHTDLQSVRKKVIDAKQAVAKAIRVAKSGSETKEGTSSGSE